MIYFDQAATSFPKPQEVAKEVAKAIEEYGANPGRGSHQFARRAAEVIENARFELAEFFGLAHPRHCFFYSGATAALNQAIKGFPLKENDRVITTTFEHNSVRRPLEWLRKEKNVEIDYVTVREDGTIPEKRLKNVVNDRTKLFVINHGSNVTGMIVDLRPVIRVAQQNDIPVLLDASQTAGVLPIDMEELGVDMVAFSGHKGLLGPQGIGALLVRKGYEKLQPLLHGGTGAQSETADQPKTLPERLEAGTLNTPGIAGLIAGLREVKRLGTEWIWRHERELADQLLSGLQNTRGVRIYGSKERGIERLGVISFTIDGTDVHEVAAILDSHYNIAVRAGLHCSPLAHETIGALKSGTIRISFGPYNKAEEVETFLQAIREIAAGLGG